MTQDIADCVARYERLVAGFLRVCGRYDVREDAVSALNHYVLSFAQFYVDELKCSLGAADQAQYLSYLEAKLSNLDYFLGEHDFKDVVPLPVRHSLISGLHDLMHLVDQAAIEAMCRDRIPSYMAVPS